MHLTTEQYAALKQWIDYYNLVASTAALTLMLILNYNF